MEISFTSKNSVALEYPSFVLYFFQNKFIILRNCINDFSCIFLMFDIVVTACSKMNSWGGKESLMINANGLTIYEDLKEIVHPGHSCLIVWDVQNGLVDRIFNKEEFISNLKRLVESM